MPHPVSLALALLEHEKRPYTVLQIGAFTGNTANDPLWPIFSSGEIQYGTLIAVEPVKEYYEQLVENYAPHQNVRCLNFAVWDSNGRRPIWLVPVPPNAPEHLQWLSQISSLRSNRLAELWNRYEGKQEGTEEAHLLAILSEKSEVVPTKTLRSTMETLNTPPIELIVIDAEGAEEQILPQIDFPLRFLCYEHVLIGQQPDPEGYASIQHGMDTFRFQENDRAFLELLDHMDATERTET